MATNPKITIAQTIIKKVVGLKFKIIQILDELLSKFAKGCPSDAEIARIIKKRNQTADLINQIRKILVSLDLIIKPIQAAIPIIKPLVDTLKFNPIPSAVGGVGVPIGTIVSSAELLNDSKRKIEEYEALLEMFIEGKNFITDILAAVIEKLRQLDKLIQECALKNVSQELKNQLEIAKSAAAISGESIGTELLKLQKNNNNNGGQIGTENNLILAINNFVNVDDSNLIKKLQSPTPNEDNTYKGFKLEILLDDKSDLRFPKRYAAAKTPNGVVVLRTESSFASSANVLLDELKFAIDRDNLKI